MFRVDTDVGNVVSMITDTVPAIAQAVLRLLVLLGITLYLDWKLTLVCMSVVPVVWLNSTVFSKKLRKINRAMQQQLSQISAGLQQAISGVRLVKAFGKEKEEVENYSQNVRQSLDSKYKSALTNRLYSTSGSMVNVLWSSGISLYCGLQVINGTLTVGEMMGLTLYVFQLYGPIASFWTTYTRIQENLVSAERVLETMDVVPDITDAKDAITAPPFKGEIRFENVTFGYDSGRPVLQNISFTIPSGSTTALVGPSGIGKTTIASLLLRFYDPWEGTVSIDGYDLRKLKLQSVKDQIGVVLQEPFLNSGTIRENILYGKKDASEEEMIRAAKIADAHDFISDLPKGYKTVVGERGTVLSGGQMQRISIARAILKKPDVIIFDEATSHLDNASERRIQRMMEKIFCNRTCIIVAHRLSTIVSVDKIFVIDDGAIVQVGSHDQLIQKEGKYRELYMDKPS